ncbi:MAG: glutamine amidotransferase family protein [Pseudorhodoplanes sp.]
MCGIAGLFLKDPKLEPQLGALLEKMLIPLTDRGPDSAGFAVYGPEVAGCIKLTVRAPAGFDFEKLLGELKTVAGVKLTHQLHDTHCVIAVPTEKESAVVAHLNATPGVTIVGTGRHMELYKEVGLPKDVARRFELSKMRGTHAIGHTRMATESAVTTNGAHPFTTGNDQCLVHNGSLSNHNDVRRELIKQGIKFATENDTEVAAGFISAKLHEGKKLSEAMEASLDSLDGFYTFVIGTDSGFGVLRDPIACKPAVMAETDRWVAFGTEYRALVDLPGIEQAKVWEPEPARVYFWERN